MTVLVALTSCNGHEPRLGTVAQAHVDPPPKPSFPGDVIVPTEGVGYLPGGGSVSPSGNASYHIPLQVPPGRLGIQPELSLDYASGRGNGVVGVGWGLTGVGAVARCVHTHASGGKADGIDWDASDAWCMNGQKLVGGAFDPSDDTLVYRTEQDSFTEVRAHLSNGGSPASPSKFVARLRDGRTHVFTAISAERVEVDPLDPTIVQHSTERVVWKLAEVHDRSGNVMTFQYDSGAQTSPPFSFWYLPKSIRYTYSTTVPSTHAEREVKFIYEDRALLDQPVTYAAGLRTVLTQRLSEIQMWAPPAPGSPKALAWRYLLDYELSDSTFRSLLKSVKQCDPQDRCKWAKQLTWSTEQDAGDLTHIGVESTLVDGFVQENLGGPTWPFKVPPGGQVVDGEGQAGALIGDFDDDGRDDLLYWGSYQAEENLNLPAGQWGTLTWHLKLRLSKTDPVEDPPIEIGTAKKTVKDEDAPLGPDLPWQDLNLRASRVIDVDGDGNQELYLANNPNGSILPEYAVHEWNDATDEFVRIGPWETKDKVDFVDLNGDGRVDLVESINDHWHYRLNHGGSFGLAVDTGVTDNGENGNNNPHDECHAASVAGDLDGDGRGDLLVAGPLPCAQQVLISLDDAGGVVTTTVALPELVPNNTLLNDPSRAPHRLADINGDGLDDIVSTNTVRINTGAGFLAPVGDPLEEPRRVTPLDLNGDGRSDLVTREGGNSYLAFSMVGTTSDNLFFDTGLEDTSLAKAGDFDGDGAPEFLAFADDPDHPTETNDPDKHQRRLYYRKLSLPTDFDLLTEVKDEGASHPRETFTYSRTWTEAPSAQTCAYPQRCIKRGMTVVRAHQVSQGEQLWPATQRTLYAYDRPRSDARGRGFVGFGEVTELLDGLFSQRVTSYDNATRVPTYPATSSLEFYPLATLSVTQVRPILEQPEAVPGDPPASAVGRVLVYTPAMEWVYPTSESYVVRLESWSSVEGEATVDITPAGVSVSGSMTVLRGREGEIRYDAWNNPARIEASTIGGVTSVLDAFYLNDPATWILGRLLLTHEQVWDADDAMPAPRTVDRDYDGAGRLVAITREPSAADSRWQRTELELDGLGQVWRATRKVWTTLQADRIDYLFYDAEGIFVEQSYNAEGHWHTQVFHPALGVPGVIEDANGVISTFQYDAFGRFRGAAPGGGMEVASSYAAYQIVPGVNAGLEITHTGEDGSVAIERVDELGRSFEQRHRGFDGTWVAEDVAFNVFGTVTSASRPGAGTPSPNRARFTYDALGRLTRSVDPDGATTTVEHVAYGLGALSTSTDPDLDVRAVRTDVDDRLVQKLDQLDTGPGGTVLTDYTYGPFNQLEDVVDHLGNTTSVGYDSIGRREWLSDPDVGTTSWEYNGFDDTYTETTALGTRTFYHDELGRPIGILDIDGYRAFAWDIAPNGIGMLARTESPDQIVVEHEYDLWSRPTKEVVTLGLYQGAEEFVTKLSYDDFGRPEVVTYPEAPGRPPFEVKSSYNTFGYLADRADASDPNAVYWAVAERELDGALKVQKQGDMVTTVTHDPISGRVSEIKAKPNGQSTDLLSLSYQYYLGGDVWRRTDAVNGRMEQFEYDGLNRLTDWTVSSTNATFPARATSYAYDVLGNLETVTVNNFAVDQATFADPTRPHAMTSLNGQTFSYDARGRQHATPSRTVTYNAFDLPKTVTKIGPGGGSTTYEYDASENRVTKTDPSGAETTYIGGVYERRIDAAARRHVFLVPGEGGPAVQVVYTEGEGDELRYLTGDLHGSVSLVLDEQLDVKERRFTEPFGGRVAADGNPTAAPPSLVTRGFTGHEEENGLGLINMRGRIYDPAQRRFLTPDPLLTEPLFSQGYNRYAYVLDNPIRYTDPSGFQAAPQTPPSEPKPPEKYVETKRKRRASDGALIRVFEPAPTKNATKPGAAPEEPPPPPPPLSAVDAERTRQLGKDALQRDLARGAHESRGRSTGRSTYVVPVADGDKYHPYTDEGRVAAALFGGRPDVPPELEEATRQVDQFFLGLVPGSSIKTVLDPEASTYEKARDVVVDVLTTAGGPVAKGLKLVTKGTKAVVKGAKVAKAAEEGIKLTRGAQRILRDPALRAMKDKTLRDGILARGGGAGVVREAGEHAGRTIAEIANAAAAGDAGSEKAIKLLKQAERLGGKSHGQ